MHAGGTCDTDALNSLLRSELSAVETYDRAITKIEDQTVLADLQKTREDHAHAARVLREKVVRFGGRPAESGELWAAFASAVSGEAKVLGPATALSALRSGEEQGVNEYEDALDNEAIHPDCKDVIRTDLLPRCKRHVEELNRLMGGMK
jgi:demethoxyubiquinone hydroxylase (CLK1/Coq7/Cat5 family)